MYVAATEVLKSRFLMKTCGPWRRDEKVGLPPLEKGGLPNLKRRAFGVKETCGNCTREEKKNKKRKGIYVVYGFSHVFSIKWIDYLIIFGSFIYLY